LDKEECHAKDQYRLNQGWATESRNKGGQLTKESNLGEKKKRLSPEGTGKKLAFTFKFLNTTGGGATR